jgi:adenylate cyclase
LRLPEVRSFCPRDEREMTVALRIQVIAGASSSGRFEHTSGPLEFGRGVQREARRCRVDDGTVSDDHLRIEQLGNGRLRAENLSGQLPVGLPGGSAIEPGRSLELTLPVQLTIGKTRLVIDRADAAASSAAPSPGEALETKAFVAVAPADRAPSPDRLADWLHTIIELEHMPAGSPEFYAHVARTLVDLIGMDLGLVLLRQNDNWTYSGVVKTDESVQTRFSRTLVNYVTARRQTFFEDLNLLPEAASLENIQAAVASPIFGLHDEVVGVLYGSRGAGLSARGAIKPVEAQLVQLLSGAAGANLARATALRTRVQFEQFFSPELVRELERDPNLLEGRSEEVTLLFSDLRGFTALSQHLGAQKTCRLIRDMMEVLSEQIVAYGGVIVDYSGDGIMAMWNAPAKQSDHAVRACSAAIGMIAELPGLNKRWIAQTSHPLALGIGINTGPAQVGNTGSTRKFKYGPHGHTVNVASRVQDATKKLGIPLLITASTREQLPASLYTRRLGQVLLADVEIPMVLYEFHGESATPEWILRRDTYDKALALFESKQWAQACQMLAPLVEADLPSIKLLRRAQECMERRPDPFDPVIAVMAGTTSSI